MSPTFGVGSLTVLKTARSACSGVSVAVPVLLPGFGSGVVEVAVAVLVCEGAEPEDGVSTVATIVSVSTAPERTLPSVQLPETSLYDPADAVALTNCRPVSPATASATTTLAAESGPRFSSLTVNVTVSPTFGLGLSTVLATTRSAAFGSVGVLAVLLFVLGSYVLLLVMVTVLNFSSAEVAVTVIVRIRCAPGAIVGTAQTPPVDVGVNVVPLCGAAETKLTLSGSVSVSSTPVAVAVPLLVSVMVYVIDSPTFGVTFDVVFVTARSAYSGVKVAVPVLLPGFGSGSSAPVTVAVLVCVAGRAPAVVGSFTLAVMVSVLVAPTPTVPTSQMPVPAV